MFTLDTFLTVINLIYKNLFYLDDSLLIIINTIKLFAKKKNINLDNIVTMKIKIGNIQNKYYWKRIKTYQLIF